MVSRVQAKFVEQGVRERSPNTRCADEDAVPVLGDSFPPQTAHRLFMVGKGGGRGSMTSIDRIGIRSGLSVKCPGSHSLKASPFTAGLPGIFIVSTPPVWRLLLSQL